MLGLLDAAIDGCTSGVFDAMVTAPVHKGVINDAGIAFSGHTEYLAERTRRRAAGHDADGRRSARRACHHAPAAREVSGALTQRRLAAVLRVLDERSAPPLRHPLRRGSWSAGSTRTRANPATSGARRSRSSAPVLRRCAARGMRLSGPVPADTAFVPAGLRGFDAVLAMYHDQGLPVLKLASFGHAVNVTLGLPIVRTSVDHGTALDIAGRGRADPGSLLEAVALAIELAARGGRSRT